jgi:hypothetical protein
MVGLFPVLSSNGDLCSGFVVQDLWYMPNVANAVAFSWVVVPALADTVILPWFDAMASFTRVWMRWHRLREFGGRENDPVGSVPPRAFRFQTPTIS